MAKKVEKKLKMQIKGGQANPAPPIGPALGQAGINIGDFVNRFNEATREQMGEVVSVVISVFDDRSFDFVIKTPPVSAMIKKALNLKSGSGRNRVKKVGNLTEDQLRQIATDKMPDLNAHTVEAAMEIVRGTARSMGITVEGAQ